MEKKKLFQKGTRFLLILEQFFHNLPSSLLRAFQQGEDVTKIAPRFSGLTENQRGTAT